MTSEHRLIISYSTETYDVASADTLLLGAAQLLGFKEAFGGSGAGFGHRDMEFYFPNRAAAERAQMAVEAVGLPLALEFDIFECPRDDA